MVPAAAISQAIRGAASFSGGQTWALLCDAIGNAVASWAVLPGSILIQGVTTGVIGSGTVTGTLTFTGSPSLVVAQMTAGGLIGATTPQVGTAIGTGLLSSLSGAMLYQGVSVGVASGTDLSFVASVSTPSLVSALQLAHLGTTGALGGSGASLPAFYTSIAAGVAAIIQTGVTLGSGIVAPAGPLGPGSSTGTSTSFVV
jgi:hypothetical protein